MCNIEQPGEAERRIDSEAGDFATRLNKTQLEKVIGEAREEFNVVKKTADAFAHRSRCHSGRTPRRQDEARSGPVSG